MIGTRDRLTWGLTYFFPNWRIVECPKKKRLDIFVYGRVTTEKMAELDIVRPPGWEFRIRRMSLLQRLWFDAFSWDVI
jgi:hypothetical protein